MKLPIIEHPQQQVPDAFSQGQCDQIQIIGRAGEKELFERCFQEKIPAPQAHSVPAERKKEEALAARSIIGSCSVAACSARRRRTLRASPWWGKPKYRRPIEPDISKLRQQLRRACAARAKTWRRPQRSQPRAAQGCFYLLRRKCVKPNCRCATAQLHANYVLTRSEAGKDRLYPAPKYRRAQGRQWAPECRRYQRARALLTQRHLRLFRHGGPDGPAAPIDLAAEPGGAPWLT